MKKREQIDFLTEMHIYVSSGIAHFIKVEEKEGLTKANLIVNLRILLMFQANVMAEFTIGNFEEAKKLFEAGTDTVAEELYGKKEDTKVSNTTQMRDDLIKIADKLLEELKGKQ